MNKSIYDDVELVDLGAVEKETKGVNGSLIPDADLHTARNQAGIAAD